MSVRSSYRGLGFVMFYVDISYHLNYPSSCIFPNDRNPRHNRQIDRKERLTLEISEAVFYAYFESEM